MIPERSHASALNGLALLRITLGIIILRTWAQNLGDDLYTSVGLEGFFAWLYQPVADGGNGSSLGFYDSLLDAVVVPVAGLYTKVQLLVELLIGVGLLVGAFTRLCSIVAAVLFFNLYLAYFGGEEWIWTYVLLFVTSVALFLGHAGRRWGLDDRIEGALTPRFVARLL